MMLQSVTFNSFSSSLVGANSYKTASSSSRSDVNNSSTKIIRCSSRNYNVPKLEPFSRSPIDRLLKDPPLIEKTENQLADYCTVLEGDDCYNCWKAYFELEELQKEAPKEDVERLIIHAEGLKNLIHRVHGTLEIYKSANRERKERASKESAKIMNREEREADHRHVPDGLPKTREELEEEEKARMPDSPFTRLLRVMGRHPDPYSSVLDY